MNFRATSPDIVTRAVLEGLIAELAEKTEADYALVRYNGRVCLHGAVRHLASDNETVYFEQGPRMSEYMPVRHMYWFLVGLLNGLDSLETLVYESLT